MTNAQPAPDRQPDQQPAAAKPTPAEDTVDRDGEPDVDRIRAAVLACPDVAAMSGGMFGEVASYLPGRRVAGVRIGDDAVEVHVIAQYGRPLTELAELLDARLADELAGRRLIVAVDDVQLPGEPLPGASDDAVER